MTRSLLAATLICAAPLQAGILDAWWAATETISAPAQRAYGYLWLDGTNDAVRITTAAALTNDMSFVLWFNPSATQTEGGGRPRLFADDSPSMYVGWINSLQQIELCGPPHPYYSFTPSPSPYPSDQWTMLAVIMSGASSNVTIYTDAGKLHAGTSVYPGFTWSGARYIGAQKWDQYGSYNEFRGAIDEVLIFSEAISSNDVVAINAAGRFGLYDYSHSALRTHFTFDSNYVDRIGLSTGVVNDGATILEDSP